jgi:ribonuclease R
VVKRYHKKDPHRKREKKKYGFAAPSREYLLQYLNDVKKPVTWKHLVQALGVSEAAEDAFSFRLKAMLRDGQIHKNRRGSYAVVSQLDLVPGTVMGHKDGYGFVITDTAGPDIFLPQRDMSRLFNNDRVLVRVTKVKGRSKRLEGALVEVLERRTRFLVGKLWCNGHQYYVQSDHKNCAHDIVIPSEDLNSASDGDYVRIEITQQPGRRRPPVGKVVQILGRELDSGLEVELAISNYNLRVDWPEEVQQELLSIDSSIEVSADRKDCRELDFITIDGEDAKDFDDAVYCEPRSDGGFSLKVAIADVAHYVSLHSALDKEAYARSTSVYIANRVLPMLPEVLSNGLCSLKPDEDRYAMVADIVLNAAGEVQSTDFYNAVIRSKARLTYAAVAEMLEGKASEIRPTIRDLYSLFQCLLEQRKIRGSLDFDVPEPQVIFNDDGKIQSIVARTRQDSHRLIEECMLLANVAVARFIESKKSPCLFRVHDQPEEEKMQKCRQFMQFFSLSIPARSKPSTKDFSMLLEQIAQRPERNLLQRMVLRTQQQARYFPANNGHFGLGYDHYTHFTSPIRRYPDLIVHRTLKELLNKQDAAGHLYSEESIDTAAAHCSSMERNAEKATREAMDRLKCDFMVDKVGNQYPGTIVEVTNFGVFVELDGFYIQGLVHITALKNDYYHFDELTLTLAGKHSGQRYAIGDSVQVLVSRVDKDQRKIDFDLVDAGA